MKKYVQNALKKYDFFVEFSEKQVYDFYVSFLRAVFATAKEHLYGHKDMMYGYLRKEQRIYERAASGQDEKDQQASPQ